MSMQSLDAGRVHQLDTTVREISRLLAVHKNAQERNKTARGIVYDMFKPPDIAAGSWAMSQICAPGLGGLLVAG